MDYYKPKLTLLSVKHEFESKKYKKYYEKTIRKNLTPSYFQKILTENSHEHLIKSSSTFKITLNPNDLYNGSVEYYSNQTNDVNLGECLDENSKNPQKFTQTELKSTQKAKKSLGLDLLKKEVLDLKTEILDIQKFLQLRDLRKNLKFTLTADKENLENPKIIFRQ